MDIPGIILFPYCDCECSVRVRWMRDFWANFRTNTRFIMILSGKSIVLAIASTTSLKNQIAACEFRSISSRLLEGADQSSKVSNVQMESGISCQPHSINDQ